MRVTRTLFTARFQQIWSHSGFRRYLTNAGWLLAARVLTLATSFLATLYIARGLGPENFGQLSYALSFVALFGVLASLGIDGILYRDLIRFPERRESILGTALSIRLFSGMIVMILAASLGFHLTDDVSALLICVLSGTLLLSSFQLLQFEFQARALSKYPSIIAITVAIVLSLLKVVVVASGEGIIYLALLLLLEPILYGVAYLVAYHRYSQASVRRWRFDSTYARTLLIDSMPLIAFSAFSVIYARIDQVFIKHLLDARSVGIYDAAVRIAELWIFIPGLITTALFPALVNAKSVSEETYNKRLARLVLVLLSVAFVIAASVSLLAPLLMYILYGEMFAEGIPVLRIYVWALVGTSFGVLITQYLVTENLRRILTFIAFVPMAVNVGLNILWIPSYGIVGAAYATLISYSLTPLALLLFQETRSRIAAITRASAMLLQQRDF